MNDSLEGRVFDLISKNLGIDKERISQDARIEDLSRDSIQLFELILAFEKEFGKKANYDDLIKIITVGDIIEYLKK